MWDSGHTRKAHKPRPSGSESCRNGDVPALTLSVPLTDVILTPTAPYATAVSRRAFAKYWLTATVHPAGIGLPPGEREGCSVRHGSNEVPDLTDLPRTFSALLI